MPRYVALLGSVNVGGRRMKMDALRDAFQPLGFTDVATFIASGNVLFTTRSAKTEALESKIETRLHEEFGFEVPTYIRSGAELADAATHRPFSPADHDHPDYDLYITFLKSHAPIEAESKLKALATPDDEFAIRGREKYWLRRKKVSESKITPAMFRKALSVTGTARNITTVRKLADLCAKS